VRKRVALIVLILLTALGPALGGDEKPLRETYNQAKKSVVLLVTFDAQGKAQSLGSGVILTSNGEIVTILHVVHGAKTVAAKLWNGAYLPLSDAVGIEAKADLLILKADAQDLPAARTGPMSALSVGDRIMTIGNPLGLESALSTGVVSGFRELPDRGRVVQITAPISPGSSGGGLFDLQGRLVGITCSTLLEGQNLNFAIPIERVTEIPRISARKLDRLQVSESISSGTSTVSSEPLTSLEKAKKYLSLEMFDDAGKELSEALATDKLNPEVHFYLGELFAQRKNYVKAREEFKISENLDPQSITPCMMVAISDMALLEQFENHDVRGEAIQCMRHVQQLTPTIKADRYSDQAALSRLTADIEKYLDQLLNITGAWSVPNSSGVWKFQESDGSKGKRVLANTGIETGNILILQAYGPDWPTIGYMWRNSDLDLEGWYGLLIPNLRCNASHHLRLRESDDGMQLSGTATVMPPEKPRKGCSYSGSYSIELIRN
jgi:tetratricopeptide (TPR) repeat protein